ncbi:hypothetical protein ACN4EE_11215 [Geminocystis sp. CENA526]|uniref:hypothetical protein n=1 Tax=Geminocystis sp. CENA526 TaxID=1355871 RepID=UPI003D6E2B4E
MNYLNYDNLDLDELAITINLDREEKELLESIENDEWVSIPNEKEEMIMLKSMAISSLNKTKIELELDNQDLEKMNILANKFDLSIPNLIKDILDQYLKKHLAENR